MSTVPVISCHDGSMAPVAREPVRRLVPISVFEEHDQCVFSLVASFYLRFVHTIFRPRHKIRSVPGRLFCE